MRRPPSRERAQIVVLFALALVALMALAGAVADGGTLFIQHRTAQNAADASATAGALALGTLSLPAAGDTAVAQAICKYLLRNQFGVTPTASASYITATGSVLGSIALPSGCIAPFSATAYASSTAGVQVNVTIGPYPTYLVGIVGLKTLSAAASATAALGSNYAIYSASTDCTSKDIDWSGSSVDVTGNVHANSGVNISGGSNDIGVNAALSDGGTGCGGFSNSGTGNTCSGGPGCVDIPNGTQPRPYPYWTYDTFAEFTAANAGCQSMLGSAPYTGTYCLSGTGDVNLSTCPTSPFTLVANGKVNLSVSGCAGLSPAVGNILLASFKNNPGNTTMNVSGSSVAWNGIIYAPGGEADVSGSGGFILQGSVVADTVKLSGSNWSLSGGGGGSPVEMIN